MPASFIGTDMGYVTFGMANLVHDPHKLAGKVGTGNEQVDYGDPSINAAVARVAPNPGAASRLEAFYTPTGDTRRAKIVSLHTDKDGLVIVENESEYASLADPPPSPRPSSWNPRPATAASRLPRRSRAGRRSGCGWRARRSRRQP